MYILITAVFVFRVFPAVKSHFCRKTDYHSINNYVEILGPLLTFSIKRAPICEFFVATTPDF